MDRRKELKLQYKQTRPAMGIFIIYNNVNNKCYIQGTQDLRGVMNGARVRLLGNSHIFKELQKDWNELGAESFTFEILENLEYDKDESKTDYTEELKLLEMMWEDKLAAENRVLYKKHI